MSATRIGFLKIDAAGTRYVYDTTTNSLVKVEETVHRLLDDYLAGDRESFAERTGADMSSGDVRDAVSFLDHARDEVGMFQPYARKDFTWIVERERQETGLAAKLAALGLNVTEQCNQRCRYCIYSGDYEGERVHQKKSMSWETATQSIDYFLARASDEEDAEIAFYGGEPLLNWDLIRRCVAYAREQRPERLALRMTTNLSHCSEEMLDFLVESRIQVNVSLDGPAAIHDAGRVFAGGKGTHESVLRNLLALRERDPAFFRSKVGFQATFDKNQNIHDVFDYFCDDLFLANKVQISLVKQGGAPQFAVSPEAARRHEERLEELIERYLDSLRTNAPFHYGLFQHIFNTVFTKLASRHPGLEDEKVHPNRTCVPGQTHLLAGADGCFYMCEKVCSPQLAIGDCHAGIDHDRVCQLLEAFVEMCDELCHECWARRFCEHCFAHVVENGRLDRERKLRACERTKTNLERAFRSFIYIWENEPVDLPPDLFEHTLHAAVARANERAMREAEL